MYIGSWQNIKGLKISGPLRERIIGAVLYGAFIFISFGWNRFSFLTGVFILMILSIYEAIQIDAKLKSRTRAPRRGLTYATTLLCAGFMLGGSLSLSFQNILTLLIVVGILHHLYLFYGYADNRLAHYRKLPAWLWVAAYVGLSIGALYTYSIILFEYDITKVFHVLLCVWVTDIAAYFTGSRWGKHKFAPSVSPKKTWEGVIGGMGMALIFSYAYGYFTGMELRDALIIGFIISITTVLGDLSESGLKRVSGIKDSGKLIPGHGGILDRIDGYLYVQPFIALYYMIS